MSGLLITFEGGEGSGKSTQVRLLSQRLQTLGWPCLCTREPGGTPLGQSLRELLLHKTDTRLDPLAELLLYAADRAQHITEVIHPALQAGHLVLCDRHTDSTLAYQGYGRGLDLSLIEQLNSIATQGIRPDITFWLNLSPDLGLARTRQRQSAPALVPTAPPQPNRPQTDRPQTDRMEQTALVFHQRIAAGFAHLAQTYPDRIRPINAEGSPDWVAEQIWQTLTSRYPHLQQPPL